MPIYWKLDGIDGQESPPDDAPDERYSFAFDGNSQSSGDHVAEIRLAYGDVTGDGILGDGSVRLIGTSDALAPSDFFLI